ncbi:MAG: FAD:protein FMN transferase [Candidatus Omnitrophica bacterium]|nr:FAD:protein FMN transferase [Candidatus Omnitrophota bacterium]
MGTTARITVIPDTPENQAAVHKIFARLNEYDRRFSFFSLDSELSRLNAAAAVVPQKVSPDLLELIAESLCYSGLTRGIFDVTATSLQRQSGYGSIIIDKSEQTVGFSDPKTKIDLGGIAVGYCIDKAAAQLHRRGIENFLIDIGGDIIAFGRNAGNQSWQIGLQDPFSTKEILASFPLNNEAVTTSGNYVKKHIIDPKTGTVSGQNPALSVAVFAPRCVDADVLATALFVCGPGAQAEEIVHKVPGMRAVFVIDRGGKAEMMEIK